MDRFGSWLCENSSGRATRRNISEQLHLWESNHTAQATVDALPENCVFYISRMYEFLHRLGQSRRSNTSDEFAGCPLHLQSRPNFGAAANRRGVPLPDSCSAAKSTNDVSAPALLCGPDGRPPLPSERRQSSVAGSRRLSRAQPHIHVHASY